MKRPYSLSPLCSRPRWQCVTAALAHVALLALSGCAQSSKCLAGFESVPQVGEQQLVLRAAPEMRIWINAPAEYDPARSTEFILYALPNGNSIEQTIGCAPHEGLDWHYAIQQIGAQVRCYRRLAPDRNVVLLLLEADQRSWPAWRAAHPDNAARIRILVDDFVRCVPHDPRRCSITLAAHSGGGSFITGFINGGPRIPPEITRIIEIDANYSYSGPDRHGDKLIAWLRASRANRLAVFAYDDREIELNGRKVVGPTGGTWRATKRMIADFLHATDLQGPTPFGDAVELWTALDGRARFYLHRNPQNRILHTWLVGEYRGLLLAVAGVQPTDLPLQDRPPRQRPSIVLPIINGSTSAGSATVAFASGRAFMESMERISFAEQQQRIEAEILAGNVPADLVSLVPVLIAGEDRSGRRHSIVLHVTPDYLAIGRTDPVRVPMAPRTAWRIARAVDCTLPTPRMVDAVHSAARLRLEPRPLTDARTEIATFIEHSAMIDDQIAGARVYDADGRILRDRPPGSILVAGCKKDLVRVRAANARAGHVAIYGWHYPDGRAIQPLSQVHADGYIDYSHGVRLVANDAVLDGRPVRVDELLADESLAPLIGYAEHPE